MTHEFIKEADIRALARLLGDAAVICGGLLEKKAYILNGLCDFSGAREWRWALFSPGSPRIPFLSVSQCASTEAQPLVLTGLSATRSQPTLEALPGYHLVAQRQNTANDQSVITLLRDHSERPYTEREELAARLVLDHLPWLHEQEPLALPATTAPPLSPRLAFMLTHLRAGLSRKEIAALAGVSLGTIHGYVKKLYECYQVHSHRELMGVQTPANLPSPTAKAPHESLPPTL